MSSDARIALPEYNAKGTNAGVDAERKVFVEQLKQQLQDLRSELAAAHKLLAEIVSPTESAGRNPLFVYYTDCRQEIDRIQTEQNRLYFLLGNDHD